MGKFKGHSLANTPLPPCQGPKLHPFKCENPSISWGKRLDDDGGDSSPTQGVVFEVAIESRAYALKVFKFCDPYSTEHYWGPLLGNKIPLQDILYYTDPFFAECRAYGRIHDARLKDGNKGALAVKCHGYLYLSNEDEALLTELGVDLGSDISTMNCARRLGEVVVFVQL
ncbi:hypothetical protein PG994_007669 [Apiospora phragmitis]|uniref:Uncharacterized protein n=1 Tax=Apiospora phragmitis TaxID=2905665 RepID=A0ABR1UQW1_9PEZI